MRNFLSRRSAVPPPEIRAALEELEQLRQNRPVLGEHAAFLGAILPGLFEQAPRETLPTIDPEHSAAKLAGGVPLLRGEQLALEPKGLPRRWLHICAALEKQKSRDMGRKLADGMRKGQVGPQEWLTDLLAGNPQAVHERAEALNLDPALAATVFRLTVLPSLAEINTQLQPLRDAAKWERGYCPTCGSWPLLGEYRLPALRPVRGGMVVSAPGVPVLHHARSPPTRLFQCRRRREQIPSGHVRCLPAVRQNGLDARVARYAAAAGGRPRHAAS